MSGRLRAWLRSAEFADAVLPTLAIRAALLVAAPLAVIFFGDDAARSRIPWEIWNAWDAPHYFEVAEVGYVDPARSVLFPLLPALLRAGSLVAPPLAVGLVLSVVATVAAAIGVHRLALLDGRDRRTARAAALAVSVFPTSFALVPPYTEPLFLAFAAFSFVRARRGDWVGAGTFGMLAALTRLPGAFLLPALLFELRGRRPTRAMLGLGLVAIGPLAYLAINWQAYGDPLFFIEAQRHYFHVETVAPWTALAGLLGSVASPRPDPFWVTVYLAPLLALLLLAVTVAWTLVSRRSRPSYAVYAAISLLSFASISWPISVPRYILGVVPMFLMLGRLGRSRLGSAALVASALLLMLLTSQFALGHWAF